MGVGLSLKKLHWLTKKDESAEESEKKWLERSVRKEVTTWHGKRQDLLKSNFDHVTRSWVALAFVSTI